MRDFLLDTQTIRYWHDNGCAEHAAVTGNIVALRKSTGALEFKPKLLVSVVTLGEIAFGHRVALVPDLAAQAEYVKFVQEELPNRLELTEDAAEAYGELRTRLFNKYAPGDLRKPRMRPEQLLNPATALQLQIQENDLWLCAQAIAHGVVFVTNDRMQVIRDVAGGLALHTQNWTVANTAALAD